MARPVSKQGFAELANEALQFSAEGGVVVLSGGVRVLACPKLFAAAKVHTEMTDAAGFAVAPGIEQVFVAVGLKNVL